MIMQLDRNSDCNDAFYVPTVPRHAATRADTRASKGGTGASGEGSSPEFLRSLDILEQNVWTLALKDTNTISDIFAPKYNYNCIKQMYILLIISYYNRNIVTLFSV